MSICTVVSLLPYPVGPEIKPSLIPDSYIVPAAKDGHPGILHVHDARGYVYLDHDRGTYPLTHNAAEIANAIVNDYIQAQLEYTLESHPGLFFVDGEFTAEDIEKKFPDRVKEAKKKQNAWYSKLVRKGDDDWQRYHQHKMIADIQRHAARELGLGKLKEWASEPLPIDVQKCPACMSSVPNGAIVCMNCKAVLDSVRAKELVFAK